MKVQKVTKETKTQIQSDLRSLPTKDMALGMRLFIESITPDIQRALEKGYSFEEIQAILEKQNIAVKASTIRKYYKTQENILSEKREKELEEKRARRRVIPASASFVVDPDTPDGEL